MIDATFWVAISFLLFVVLLFYFKVPQKVDQSLNESIKGIKSIKRSCFCYLLFQFETTPSYNLIGRGFMKCSYVTIYKFYMLESSLRIKRWSIILYSDFPGPLIEIDLC